MKTAAERFDDFYEKFDSDPDAEGYTADGAMRIARRAAIAAILEAVAEERWRLRDLIHPDCLIICAKKLKKNV